MLLLQADTLNGIYEVTAFDTVTVVLDAADFICSLDEQEGKVIGAAFTNADAEDIAVMALLYGIKRLPA